MIKWLTSCLLPRQRETKSMPARKKSWGRLRESEVSFPLAIVAHHVVPPGICPGPIQNHPDFRWCHRHLRLSVEDVNIAWVAFLVSEEYSITHY